VISPARDNVVASNSTPERILVLSPGQTYALATNDREAGNVEKAGLGESTKGVRVAAAVLPGLGLVSVKRALKCSPVVIESA